MEGILRIDEIDRLVAEKVMGWELCDYGFWETEVGPLDSETEFNPSTDISDAWLVLEKSGFHGEVGDIGGDANSFPMAICLAALKAVGIEVVGTDAADE
jgi:hypothetical protein